MKCTMEGRIAERAKPLPVTAVTIDGIIHGLEWEQSGGHLLPGLVAVRFRPERLFCTARRTNRMPRKLPLCLPPTVAMTVYEA